LQLIETHTLGRNLWKRDRPVAGISTWQHTTHKTDRYPGTHDPVGIRTRNPSKRALANWRLRTRGHRCRLLL